MLSDLLKNVDFDSQNILLAFTGSRGVIAPGPGIHWEWNVQIRHMRMCDASYFCYWHNE